MPRAFPENAELITRDLFPGVIANVCAGEHLTLSRVHFEPHGVVQWHSHPHEQVGVMVSGKARFEIGDEVRILSSGDIYRIPSGILHKVSAIDGPAIAFDVFFPARPEYLVPQT